MNIRKINKKDDFVDVFDGQEWSIRMTDKAHQRIMRNIESIFTDYLDDLHENKTEEFGSARRSLNAFLNSVSFLLEWEFNNIENNRDVKPEQMERFQNMMKKMVVETIYRESSKTVE